MSATNDAENQVNKIDESTDVTLLSESEREDEWWKALETKKREAKKWKADYEKFLDKCSSELEEINLQFEALADSRREEADTLAYCAIENDVYLRFRLTLIKLLVPIKAIEFSGTRKKKNRKARKSLNRQHPSEFVAYFQKNLNDGKLDDIIEKIKVDPKEFMDLVEFALTKGEPKANEMAHPLLILKDQYRTMNGDGFNLDHLGPLYVEQIQTTLEDILDVNTRNNCLLIVQYMSKIFNKLKYYNFCEMLENWYN